MLDGELEYRRANYEVALASLRQAIQEENISRIWNPGAGCFRCDTPNMENLDLSQVNSC
jgi:hypothetical protein